LTFVAGIIGYLIGSIPTAGLLGRLRGVDLRSQGSGNPGTANALRTSGVWLAAAVLVVEATKGYLAVLAGSALGDEIGAIAAGLGAVTGNVYNVWYRFRGGKGLGISLGVLAALWPAVLPVVIVVISLGAIVSRSSSIAALLAIAALISTALLWVGNGWATGGVEPTGQLLVIGLGIGLIVVWKHWRDAPFREPAPR
jgi:glycerol-3-phosphate acyltransferase PlsY